MLLTKRVKILIIISVLATVLPLAFILPMYFCTKFGLSNCFIVVACIYLGFTGLYLVTRAGTFDVFRYQFINWTYSFRKGSKLRYKDAYSYQEHLSEHREESRKYWIPFVVVGTICLILSIVFAFYPL